MRGLERLDRVEWKPLNSNSDIFLMPLYSEVELCTTENMLTLRRGQETVERYACPSAQWEFAGL